MLRKVTRSGTESTISWRESINIFIFMNKANDLAIKGIALYGLWVLYISVIEKNFSPFIMLAGVLMFFAFVMPYLLPKFFTRSRQMTISGNGVQIRRRHIPLDRISRVEYGSRGEWDMSKPTKKDRIQIRLWIDDESYVLVSENNNTLSNNHHLHATIQKEISSYRKRDRDEPDQPDTVAQGPSKTDDFGMPDY